MGDLFDLAASGCNSTAYSALQPTCLTVTKVTNHLRMVLMTGCFVVRLSVKEIEVVRHSKAA